MIRTRFVIVVGAALLALTGTGCDGASSDKAGGVRHKPVVLTLASHETGAGVQEWIDAVERLAGGSLRIEVKRGWRDHEVDYEKQTIADVRSGKLDLASIPARAYDSFGIRSFQALLAPFLIDSYALQRKVLVSELPDQMLPRVKPLGVVGIALLPGELQKTLNVRTPMLAPSDYRGTRIGIRPSEVAARTFRALGAIPRSMAPGGDILPFDGAEQDIFQIVASKYHAGAAGEALPINVNFWPRVASIVMNDNKYDGLTPEQREALRNGDREAIDPAMKRLAHDQDDAVDVICDVPGNQESPLFLVASPSNLAALRRAVRPVYRRLDRDPETRRAIKSIAAMRENVVPEHLPSCRGTPRRHVGANVDAVALNVTGDLNKTGPTTWKGTVTSTELGRGQLVLEGHAYFSRLIHRRYFTFKGRFSKGELRGCVVNAFVPRPNGDYGWDGPGDVAGASGALRKYVGLTLRFDGITRKSDLSHVRGGFRSDAPTGLTCF